MNKRIKVITTGGTIAGNVANTTSHSTSEDFMEVFDRSIKVVKQTWNVSIDHSFVDLFDIDSSNINPTHWQQIAHAIKEHYDETDAYIVVHGTNTMGYTSAALSFALENIAKPVIFTGAQVPLGYLGSDATTNLVNALRVAVWPHHEIRGVLAVFGSKIITGARVKKGSDFDYDPFSSFQSGSLGQIGRFMKIDEAALSRHNAYLSKYGSPALTASSLKISANYELDKIISLTEFPGMSPDLITTHLGTARGIILRSFGAGDPNSNLFEPLALLKEKKIPIVVTTQAPGGVSNFRVNETGQYLLENSLAIPAHDMSIESMTTKLAWLLAKDSDYETIKSKMVEDLHGEINVNSELV